MRLQEKRRAEEEIDTWADRRPAQSNVQPSGSLTGVLSPRDVPGLGGRQGNTDSGAERVNSAPQPAQEEEDKS